MEHFRKAFWGILSEALKQIRFCGEISSYCTSKILLTSELDARLWSDKERLLFPYEVSPTWILLREKHLVKE